MSAWTATPRPAAGGPAAAAGFGAGVADRVRQRVGVQPAVFTLTPLAMRYLPLMNAPFVALVDDDVYELASQYHWWWRPQNDGRNGYVVSYDTPRPTRLHHLALRPGPRQVIDHVDHDTLNNCGSNLRVATRSESNHHRRMPVGRSGSRGVQPHRNRFRATIWVRGVRHHLGMYASVTDAALAYDRAARHWFGPFAICNFPH